VTALSVGVVGGGPAGLNAAVTLARLGASVRLYDDQLAIGGRLRFERPAGQSATGSSSAPLFALGDLVDEAARLGVHLASSARVWSLIPDLTLGIATESDSVLRSFDAVVLATGSTDLPLPIPGGTLVGVMTASAMRLLIRHHGVLPGRRFAIVGDGEETSDAAAAIFEGGGEIAVQVSPSTSSSIEVRGDQNVESVVINGRSIETDIVVIAVGRQPDIQLALSAGCDARWNLDSGHWRIERDRERRTTIEGLYVAGDAVGPSSVETSAIDGYLTGVSVAATLGLCSSEHYWTETQAWQGVLEIDDTDEFIPYAQPWRPRLLKADHD
jgi:thioredoxin reductase